MADGITSIVNQLRASADDFANSEPLRAAIFGFIGVVLLVFQDVIRKVVPAWGTSMVERLKARADKQRQEVVTLQALNERLNADGQLIHELRTDLDGLKREREQERIDRQRQEGEYQTEIGKLNSNMAELSTTLGKANEKIDTLETANRQLTTDLASAHDKINALETTNADTLRKLEAETQARTAAENREKAALAENETLRLEKSQLVKRIEDLTEHQNTMQKQVDDLSNEVTRLKADKPADPPAPTESKAAPDAGTE